MQPNYQLILEAIELGLEIASPIIGAFNPNVGTILQDIGAALAGLEGQVAEPKHESKIRAIIHAAVVKSAAEQAMHNTIGILRKL